MNPKFKDLSFTDKVATILMNISAGLTLVLIVLNLSKIFINNYYLFPFAIMVFSMAYMERIRNRTTAKLLLVVGILLIVVFFINYFI